MKKYIYIILICFFKKYLQQSITNPYFKQRNINKVIEENKSEKDDYFNIFEIARFKIND